MGLQRAAWEELADGVVGLLQAGEHCLIGFSGEESDFVRFNHARIRQAGRVVQGTLTIDLISGSRHASASCRLGGGGDGDLGRVAVLLGELRAQLPVLGEDPHLLYSDAAAGSVREDPLLLPDSAVALDALDRASDLDLVGLWAAGTIQRGFASSFGQRSWHSVHSFNASWSCHLAGDRSVSGAYAGTAFDGVQLAARLQASRSELAGLARPAVAVAPGRYRAYLAPAAVRELLGMLCWGGFSLKAQRSSTSPLLRLARGEARLASAVALSEDRACGLAPRFTASGFSTPAHVPLVSAGAIDQLLVSPRSAREFGLAPNADEESPHSLVMAGGELAGADVLKRLGRGLWIGNLWYCNFSDPNACRITGMTRFACWWVEDGEIRGPLPVMRFDDSIYGLLGERLLAITAEREHLHSASTYSERTLESMLVPGLLVEGLELTG
jgi:predicted Zn-dependent protease